MDALVDHRGAEADYLAALAELVEKEGVQVVEILDGDVEQEIVAAASTNTVITSGSSLTESLKESMTERRSGRTWTAMSAWTPRFSAFRSISAW